MPVIDTVVDGVIKVLPHDQADADVVAALRRKHPGELLIRFPGERLGLIPWDRAG